MNTWTLFSNHGHVLFCLARNPEARLRDVAADVGITERAVQKIVRDLQDGGMVSVTKKGRRNSYRIDKKKPLRHELESACTLKDLIKIVNKDEGPVGVPAAKLKPMEASLPGGDKTAEKAVEPARPAAPKQGPAKTVRVKTTPQAPGPSEPEADNSDPSDSIERQQGSLF